MSTSKANTCRVEQYLRVSPTRAPLTYKSRTNALQPQNPTERFRYDPLERLTCAYFNVTENDSYACEYAYGYRPNDNISVKADQGNFAYDDPAHPHAVTSAGADNFGYDAVGNQVSRTGGVTVTYTPFDLPKAITQGAVTKASFGYDGDEQRIRKTTPDEAPAVVRGRAAPSPQAPPPPPAPAS